MTRVLFRRRSGSESGSHSRSQSASSRSRSRSRSPSSASSRDSSGSSCSSASSSPGSDKSVSPHRSVGSSHHGSVRGSARLGSTVQSAVSAPHQNNSSNHSDDTRPLVICVRNLPIRSSDTSLKDGLFHEYKKHGKVTCVKVVGQAEDRYALVRFKKPEDAEKALEESHNKLFFGCKIEVAAYQGYDVDDNEFRPYEAELDEYHPKATRTLFIGNLEKDISPSEIRKHFEQFGEIIEIDIKKQGGATSYAFCQFADIGSVVKAMRSLDGEHLGSNRIKLGFGKSMQTNCVWVGGLGDNVQEKYLNLQFNQFGAITQVSVDRERGYALIFFEQVLAAQMAVKEMRGVNLRGRKVQIDFASRECQDAFFVHMEKQGSTDRAWRETPYDSSTAPAARFETAVVTAGRFSRFEATPQRQRTASYSRSGTPGSTSGNVTPSGSSTPVGVTRVVPRTPRSSQRYELFDAPSASDFADRRSYDEFSQGSGGASGHSDGYEGSPSLRGGGESGAVSENEYSKRLQSVVVSEPGLAHPHPHGPHHSQHHPHPHHGHPPQGELRTLQKERMHIQHQLDQLDDGDSSGSEATFPRKRVRVDDSEVTCDALHNHRRSVSEVRRLSEGGKHCGRRQSTDSGKHCSIYSPHPVCKRRKTGSSTSETDERRYHHHHHHNNDVTVLSGNESGDNSRPGTPLFDERPENILPTEPRRPRERLNDIPLSLPLPRFAAQLQFPPRQSTAAKLSSISSPPAVTSPKPVSLPVPSPNPSPAPPPASPPPTRRPPSAPSPSSSDSDGGNINSPKHSPTTDHSLEERVKALDKMYEQWTGSRAICASGGDTLSKVDNSVTERLRSKHKCLDFDLPGMRPSEIVSLVLAKRSVFDEDSKRLENVSDKYEPKEFVPATRALRIAGLPGLGDSLSKGPISPSGKSSLFPSPLSSPSALSSSTPTLSAAVPAAKSPLCVSSASANINPKPMSPTVQAGSALGTSASGTQAPSKLPVSISIPKTPGLQYPFPSHPPTSVQPATTPAASPTASTAASGSASTCSSSVGLLSVVATSSSTAPLSASTTPTTSRSASPETSASARLKLTLVTAPVPATPSTSAEASSSPRVSVPCVSSPSTGGVTACVSGSDPRLTKMASSSSPTTAVTACSGNTPSPEATRTSATTASNTAFPGLASPEGSRLSASAAASPPRVAALEAPSKQENLPKSVSGSGQVCASSIPSRLSASSPASRNIPVSVEPARTLVTPPASAGSSVDATMTSSLTVTTASPTVVTSSFTNAIPVSSPSSVPSADISKSLPKKDISLSQSKLSIKKDSLSSPTTSPSQSPKEKITDAFAKVSAPSRRESASSSTSTTSSSSSDNHKISKHKSEEKKDRKEVPASVASRRNSEPESEKRRERTNSMDNKEHRRKDKDTENHRRKERDSLESSEKDRSRKHHSDKKEGKEGSPLTSSLDRRKDEKRDGEKNVDRRRDERRKDEKSERRKESSDKSDRHRDDKRKESSSSSDKYERRKEEKKEAERNEERLRDDRLKEENSLKEAEKSCDKSKETERLKETEKHDVERKELESERLKEEENLKEEERLREAKEAERLKEQETLKEAERLKELEKAKELERQKEQERQKELDRLKEMDKQKELEKLKDLEKQKEFERQKELEKQKEQERQKEHDRQLERQKEVDKKREEELKKKEADRRRDYDKSRDPAEKQKKSKDPEKHAERQREREERKKEDKHDSVSDRRRHTTDGPSDKKRDEAIERRRETVDGSSDRKHSIDVSDRKHSSESKHDREHDRRKEDPHSERKRESTETAEKKHGHSHHSSHRESHHGSHKDSHGHRDHSHGHHGHSQHSVERRESRDSISSSVSSDRRHNDSERRHSEVEKKIEAAGEKRREDRKDDHRHPHIETAGDKKKDSTEVLLEKFPERRRDSTDSQMERKKDTDKDHHMDITERSVEVGHSSVLETVEMDDVSEKRKEKQSSEERRKERKERKERIEKAERSSAPLPAPIGGKRRISSQDSLEGTPEDCKRIKLAPIGETPPERRDSKDSGRSSGSSKRSSGERHLNPAEEFNLLKLDKTPKEKKKPRTPVEMNSLIKEELESEDELQTPKPETKELKDMSPDFGSSESLDEKGRSSRKEKRNSGEFRKEEKKRKENARRREGNFLTGTDTDGSDDDKNGQSKKHSIFDIVDEGPVYISMYDKVKARSTKNMQKQEEEKRQEKMKEKFSALKQSRAKREEKKRSTSYDEDSDSAESGRGKSRRKAMVSSSSESSGSDTNKQKKGSASRKSDSESDSRGKSSTPREESEGAARTKALLNQLARKGSRSRIVSDTSEDDRAPKRRSKPANIFSDDSEVDMGFAELDDNQQYKNKQNAIVDSSDDDRRQKQLDANQAKVFMDSLKLEKRIKQNHDSGAEDDATVEGTPPPALDNCKYSSHSKDKDGVRKRSHKKKQKKQKSPPHREDPADGDSEMPDKSDLTNCVEKRKKHTKKERRKSNHSKLLGDEDKAKAHVRKLENNVKRDEKMEYIFGPLSEDSENSKPSTALNNSSDVPAHSPTSTALPASASLQRFEKMPSKWQVSQVYGSDSDSNGPSTLEREAQAAQARNKRKEKKRRERKALDEAGKALEAKLLNDDLPSLASLSPIKAEPLSAVSASSAANNLDVFQFTEGEESREAQQQEKAEVADADAVALVHKEKRKKRKKSKEEKQNRHHHHHHREHNHHRDHAKAASPDRKVSTSTPSPPEVRSDAENPTSPGAPAAMASLPDLSMPSLPSLSPPSATSASAASAALSPAASKKVLIPFNDENIHETAVKSIEQQFSPVRDQAPSQPQPEGMQDIRHKEDNKLVISQEETEDAVAALLEETFGASSDDFGEHGSSYDNEVVADEDADEETAQAVDSLGMKPETPQSENDLQIDTDTEETEADSSLSVTDRSLSTTDTSMDFSRPPRTPDLPASYYNRQQQAAEEAERAAERKQAVPSEGLMERISDLAMSSSSRPSRPLRPAPSVLPKLELEEPGLVTLPPVAAASPASTARLSSPKAASEVKPELFDKPLGVLHTSATPTLVPKAEPGTIVAGAVAEVRHDVKLDPKEASKTSVPRLSSPPPLSQPMKPLVVKVEANHNSGLKSPVDLDAGLRREPILREASPAKNTVIKGTVVAPMMPKPVVNSHLPPQQQYKPVVQPNAMPAKTMASYQAGMSVVHVVRPGLAAHKPHPLATTPHMKTTVVAPPGTSLAPTPPSHPMVNNKHQALPRGVPVPVVRGVVPLVVPQPVITSRFGPPRPQQAVVNASPHASPLASPLASPQASPHASPRPQVVYKLEPGLQSPHGLHAVAPKIISPPGHRMPTPQPTPTSVITSSAASAASAAGLLTTLTPSTATPPMMTTTQALAGGKANHIAHTAAHVVPMGPRFVNAVCGVRPSLPAMSHQPLARHMAPVHQAGLHQPGIHQPAAHQPGVLAVNTAFQPGKVPYSMSASPGALATPHSPAAMSPTATHNTLAVPAADMAAHSAASSPRRSPKRAPEENKPDSDKDDDEGEGKLCIVEELPMPSAPSPVKTTPSQGPSKSQIKCDSPIDTKDEFWSKEVNIDSVIKTVDAMCSKDEETADKRRDRATEKVWFDGRAAGTAAPTPGPIPAATPAPAATTNSTSTDMEKNSPWPTERASEPERPWLAVKPMERAKSPSPSPALKEEPSAASWLSAEKVQDTIKAESKPWPLTFDKDESKVWLAATPVATPVEQVHLAHLVANKDRDKKTMPWLEAKLPDSDKVSDAWLDKLSASALKEKDNGNRQSWMHHLTAEQERERWLSVTSPSPSPPIARSPRSPTITATAAESLEVSPLAKDFASRSPLSTMAAVSPLHRDKLEPAVPREEPPKGPAVASAAGASTTTTASPAAEQAEDDKKQLQGPASVGSNAAKSPATPASSLNESKDDADLSDAHEDHHSDEDKEEQGGSRARRPARRNARSTRNTRAAAAQGTTASQQGVTTRRRQGQGAAEKDEPKDAKDPKDAKAPANARRGRTRVRGGNDSASRKLADVYEFRDDSDEDKSKDEIKKEPVEEPKEAEVDDAKPEAKAEASGAEAKKDDKDDKSGRPRLILTIKGPGVVAATAAKDIANTAKEAAPAARSTAAAPPAPAVETREEPSVAPTTTAAHAAAAPTTTMTSSAATNAAATALTRKSRRLQEKDGSRSTVDDIIDDVVRNVAVVTRSAADQQVPVSGGAGGSAGGSAPAPGGKAASPAPAAAPGAAPVAAVAPAPAPATTPAPATRRTTRQAIRGLEASAPEQPRKSPRASRKTAATTTPAPAPAPAATPSTTPAPAPAGAPAGVPSAAAAATPAATPSSAPTSSTGAARRGSLSDHQDSSSEDSKKPLEAAPRAKSPSPARSTASPMQASPPSQASASTADTASASTTTTLKAPGKLSTRVLEKEKEKEREERERKRRLAGLAGMDPSETTEPTMMICPETGVLIPMQEAEEGQYVPVPGAAKQPIIVMGKSGASNQDAPTTWQGQAVPVKPIQTLKQHVLQQAAKQESQPAAPQPKAVPMPVVYAKPGTLPAQEQPKVLVAPVQGNAATQAAKVCVVQPDAKMNVNVVVGQPQVPQKPRDMILKGTTSSHPVHASGAVPLVTTSKPGVAASAVNAVPLVGTGKAPLGVSVAGKPAVPVMNQMSTQPLNPKAHLLQAVAHLPHLPGQPVKTTVPASIAKINQVSAVQAGSPVVINKSATVTPMTPKAHILQAVVNQNKAMAPLGVALPVPQPVQQGVVVQPSSHLLASSVKVQSQPVALGVKSNTPLSLVQPAKTHLVHGAPQQPQPQPFTGAVASPPLHKAPQQPVIAGASNFRAQSQPQAKAQGEGVPNPYAPHLRAAPPGVHDLSQHPHPVAGTQYVHPNVMYQYLRAQAVHGEGLLPYHLAASAASAGGGVVPPPRSPIVSKNEPDPEEAVAGRGAAPPGSSPPLELRRPASATTITTALSLQSPHALDRTTDSPQVATVYRMPHYGATAAAAASRFYPGEDPPPAHIHAVAARVVPAHALHSAAAPIATATVPVPVNHSPASSESSSTMSVSVARPTLSTPPLANQGPPQHDSLMMLLQRYPVMWQGLLALKNDQAAVQMHFVFGNPIVARGSLPCNSDGTTPPLRIAQRMRLEQTQIDGVTRKMQTENEHCMLLALPCGRDTMDVLQQSNNLQTAFITYLQQKQAAGIVNIAAPGSQQAAYVVHVFPSCEFANDSLARIAPDLFHRVANLAHLLIIIATV